MDWMNGSWRTTRLTRRAVIAPAATIVVGSLLGSPIAAGQAEAGWTELLASGTAPSPRWDHSLAVDGTGARLIVFGGRDGAGTALGDTWLFDLAAQTWNEVSGPAPSPRFGQAVTLDPASDTLYLFGGQDNAPTFFDDVWRFDFASGEWSEIETGDSARPAARYGTSAVLDSAGRLLVSHGFTFEGRFDDTWAFAPATGIWTDLSPAPESRPLRRCLHESIWDPIGARMVLFGGCSSGFGPCPQGDLWAFDPSAGSWTDLTTVDGPAPRSNPLLVADPVRQRALLQGGLTAGGYAADLWSLALGQGERASWQQLHVGGTGPSPRASHDGAVIANRLFLFGGSGETGPSADLWKLNLSRV